MTVDDDTVCTVGAHPQIDAGVAFVGHVEPRETFYFTNREDSAVSGGAVDVNLLGAHARLLGKPLNRLGDRSCDLNLKYACRHMLKALLTEPKSEVRVSWSGLSGDSAVYCPHGVLFNTGPDRRVLANDASMFETALSSREVLRAVRQSTVTDEPTLMLYCAALDNTRLLPPCQPTGFNEDGLFGWTLRACDPMGFIAQLPLTVVHDSPRSGVHRHSRILSAAQVRTTEVVQWLCRPWASSCAAVSVAERMSSLAEFLTTLGAMDQESFQRHLRQSVVEAKWQLATRCHSIQREGFEYPGFWRRALDDYRTALLDSMIENGFYVPIEWKSPRLLDGIAAFQRHLRMYARALASWPHLWTMWRDRRSDGLLGRSALFRSGTCG
jgi:hypothetical protein